MSFLCVFCARRSTLDKLVSEWVGECWFGVRAWLVGGWVGWLVGWLSCLTVSGHDTTRHGTAVAFCALQTGELCRRRKGR